MDSVPRTTIFRRVRRKVETDLGHIFSSPGEASAEVLPLSDSNSDEEPSLASHSSCGQDPVVSCARLDALPEVLSDSNISECSSVDDSAFEAVEFSCDVQQSSQLWCGDAERNAGPQEQSSNASFAERLRQWSLKEHIPHTALTGLLGILRSHHCFSELPSSARALLSTPRVALVEQMEPGQYCHFGLKEGLHASLVLLPYVPDPIVLHINVDGLPLTKSTQDQFWPILCKVANVEASEPFPVGVYYGKSKASHANVFLRKFVHELKEVLKQGFTIANNVVGVLVGAIICDAPAKSYILGTKAHNGYFSCTKCTTEGEFLQGRVFPSA